MVKKFQISFKQSNTIPLYSVVYWIKPSDNPFKMNVDGSLSEAVCGMVVLLEILKVLWFFPLLTKLIMLMLLLLELWDFFLTLICSQFDTQNV